MQRHVIGGMTALAPVLLAAAYTYHFLYWDFDDTYIVFRIVRNLLAGHGWAFNAGDAHNASTSVLNTIVIALAAPLFSWQIPFAAHMLAFAVGDRIVDAHTTGRARPCRPSLAA